MITSRWHVPLSQATTTLRQAYASLKEIGLRQQDVPLAVQLVENPRYDLPGIDIFHGATDLETHDLIHIILGRGLLRKDEAFVLGFTMGSTNRVSFAEERLYTFFAKHIYPEGFRFDDEDVAVFKDAVRLGYISDCVALGGVDYRNHLDQPLGAIRQALGIEEDLLRAYFAIERRRYPAAVESQRLLD